MLGSFARPQKTCMLIGATLCGSFVTAIAAFFIFRSESQPIDLDQTLAMLTEVVCLIIQVILVMFIGAGVGLAIGSPRMPERHPQIVEVPDNVLLQDQS